MIYGNQSACSLDPNAFNGPLFLDDYFFHPLSLIPPASEHSVLAERPLIFVLNYITSSGESRKRLIIAINFARRKSGQY
jgi:hypothetical protein